MTAQPFSAAHEIHLCGEIDAATGAAVGDEVCAALGLAVSPLVIDLSEVSFIDSGGVAMLIRVHEHALALHRMVWWRDAQPGPARVLELCGLGAILRFADTAKQAR